MNDKILGARSSRVRRRYLKVQMSHQPRSSRSAHLTTSCCVNIFPMYHLCDVRTQGSGQTQMNVHFDQQENLRSERLQDVGQLQTPTGVHRGDKGPQSLGLSIRPRGAWSARRKEAHQELSSTWLLGVTQSAQAHRAQSRNLFKKYDDVVLSKSNPQKHQRTDSSEEESCSRRVQFIQGVSGWGEGRTATSSA
jgi:hypothetical protein